MVRLVLFVCIQLYCSCCPLTVPVMSSTWQRGSLCVFVGIALPGYRTGCQIEQRVRAGFLRQVLSLTRELARKSFWVPVQWQLDIIYQDSAIRGRGLQKRWHAELQPLTPHCLRCCHLSPSMTDRQDRTHDKKKNNKKVWGVCTGLISSPSVELWQ